MPPGGLGPMAGFDEEAHPDAAVPCNDENEMPVLQHPNQLEPTPMDQDNNEVRVNNAGRRVSPLAMGGGNIGGGAVSTNQEDDDISNVEGAVRYHYHVGMFLDVLDTVDRWSEVEVVGVDHNAQRIAITYLYWGDKFDEMLPFDSDRIAPFKTHTYHGDPSQLKRDQRIEVFDEKKRWRQAEVVDFSDDDSQVKVHFRNFSATFDTWLPRTSERIRPFGREKVLNKKSKNLHNQSIVGGLQPLPHSNHVHAQHRAQASLNPNANHTRQLAVTSDRYNHYKAALARQQLEIFPVEGDGNCLFRSVSHQVYGDDAFHSLVREKVMTYMEVERRYFEPYVEGDMDDFLRYLDVKRRDGTWGDDPEVQAICELYDRPAVIWVYDAVLGAKKLRTFHEAGGFTSREDRHPMMLSYYGGGHYDSIVSHEAPAPLVADPPGVMEDLAIEMARQRQAATTGMEEMKRRSDEEATEQAAVEAALRASREDFDSFTDLETALELSAQAEIQAELIRSATEQSEAELMKKVMEDSLKDDGIKLPTVDDEIMQAVIESSKAEFQAVGGKGVVVDEEEEVKKAMQMSIADSDEQRQLEEALKQSQADIGLLGGAGKAYGMMMEEEDPELAAALALSMQDDVNKQIGGPSFTAFGGLEDPIQQQARNFELARKKKEEEDLRRALAASLEEN